MKKQITAVIIGLGGRGRDTYGQYILEKGKNIKVVAVADLIRSKVDNALRDFSLSGDMGFNSADELFAKEKLADVAFICTQDADHIEHATKALNAGYHLLLEKPISKDIKECQALLKLAKEKKLHVVVCHVLRYAPFFTKIKELIDSNKIGEVVTIQAIENVGYWHQAHSYVRGNWRKESESSPMILAKSCHDMDILLWLAGKKCKRVSSFGSTYLFKKENAPKGSTMRCTDNCLVKETCPYNAVKYYYDNGIKKGNKEWPVNIVARDPDENKIMEALKTGPYGRCVYQCDNDVVDHQIVNMELENSVTISFTMSAFTNECYRHIRVMGTLGEIKGDMETNILTYTTFGKTPVNININEHEKSLAGHGGGDGRLVDKFIELVNNSATNNYIETTLEASIDSHIVALLAEKSRKEFGKVMEI